MDFKKATDILFDAVDQGDIATALDVSLASVRQARLSPDASAHRSPPPDWRNGLAKLAKHRARRLLRLVAALQSEDAKPARRAAKSAAQSRSRRRAAK